MKGAASIGRDALGVWLALDCGGTGCAAAVTRGDAVLATTRSPAGHGQAEALVPLLAQVVAAAGIDFPDLDRIVVTVGPGGFTGVRLGLSAAAGLGLALSIPVEGVSSLLAAAAGVEAPDGPILALLDSRRDIPWGALFAPDLSVLIDGRAWEAAPPPRAILVGDAVALDWARRAWPERADLRHRPGPVDPAVVARLARSGRTQPPRPAYLRAPDVGAPKRGEGTAAR